MGCFNFSWFELNCNVARLIFAQNHHLASNSINNRLTDRNSSDFYYVKSYDSGKRIRMGNISRCFVHNICAGILNLPDFAQGKNLNSWLIP